MSKEKRVEGAFSTNIDNYSQDEIKKEFKTNLARGKSIVSGDGAYAYKPKSKEGKFRGSFGRDEKARSHKSPTGKQWFNVIANLKYQRPAELVLPVLPFTKSELQKNKHLMEKFNAYERTHFARKAQTAMTPIGKVWWSLALMVSPYWYHRVLSNLFKDLV